MRTRARLPNNFASWLKEFADAGIAMYALWVPSLQMFQTAMLFATFARSELFHANTKSWRNLFTSSPATLFTWLHALVFISPSLSFFSRSLLLAAQRPVFLKLTTVPLLTILVHLYPYSTVLLEARNVNHNNQLFHPLGKLVPSRSDMTVGRARAYCHGFHVYIGFQRLSVECWNWAFTH